LGGEYRPSAGWSRRLSFRAGWKIQPERVWTLGFGLELGTWRMDYAFLPVTDGDPIHRMDLSCRFGRVLPQERERDARCAEALRCLDRDDLFGARAAVEALRRLAPRDPQTLALHRDVQRRLAETVDPEALLAQAREARQGGDATAARAFYRKVLFLQPSHAAATEELRLVEMEVRRQDDERLRTELASARRRAAAENRRRARSAAARGDWTDALALWRKVSSAEPDDAESREGRTLGRARLTEAAAKADSVAAEGLLRAVLADDPTDRAAADRLREVLHARRTRARALYEEGLRHYTAGERSAARRAFEEAAALDPEDKTIRKALLRVLEEGVPK
jgi:tetratricopeptide (TPR) repeat protein